LEIARTTQSSFYLLTTQEHGFNGQILYCSLHFVAHFDHSVPLYKPSRREYTRSDPCHDRRLTQDINALSESFNTLRQTPGHFQGGTYDREVDGPKGKKFQVMKALAETLGVPGTPAADILQTMGKPDELTSKLDVVENVEIEMMPGPIIGSDDDSALASTSEQGSYYLVYYWRGSHDYLYFKVDTVSEKVTASGWYNALD